MRCHSGGISNAVGAVFLRVMRLALLAHRSLRHVAFCGLAPEGPPEVDSILKPPVNSVRDSSHHYVAARVGFFLPVMSRCRMAHGITRHDMTRHGVIVYYVVVHGMFTTCCIMIRCNTTPRGLIWFPVPYVVSLTRP